MCVRERERERERENELSKLVLRSCAAVAGLISHSLIPTTTSPPPMWLQPGWDGINSTKKSKKCVM